MNFQKTITVSGLVLGLSVVSVAQAGGSWLARTSASYGLYSINVEQGPLVSDGDGTAWAIDVGGVLGFALGEDNAATLVFDVDLEAMSVDADTDNNFVVQSDGTLVSGNSSSNTEFERTDFKFTVGTSFDVGFSLTPFVGYRYAWQGDGYFNDDLYIETGYFLGVALGRLTWIEGFEISLSGSYNDTTLDNESGPDTDATGLSARIAIKPEKSPLGFSLKYQNFDYDGAGNNKEDYLLASLTWYFAQGAM